jgi:hypothetical protein
LKNLFNINQEIDIESITGTKILLSLNQNSPLSRLIFSEDYSEKLSVLMDNANIT